MLIVAVVAVIGIVGVYLLRTAQEPKNSDSATGAIEGTAGSSAQGSAGSVAPGAAGTVPEGTTGQWNDTPVEISEVSKDETENDVQVISIEGGSFYYKPNEIRVKKGQTVKVEMKSADMMHDFVIDELGVKMPVVTAGNTGSVEFVADQVGEFEFYCSIGQHRKNGQVGRLIVEE